MSDVSEARINLQQQEISYRAAVSEATFTRVAAALNFVNKRQHDTKNFFLNGPYGLAPAPQTGVDGAYMFLFDAEITGIMMFNLVAGSSGSTTLDVRLRTASGGSSSSIFTVTPSIASTAGNNAFVGISNVPTYTILENPAGTTAPTLAVTNVNAGDLITLDTVAVQPGAQNAGLIIYFRPR
jgi:hypothetical protein